MKPVKLDLNSKQTIHLITFIRNYGFLPGSIAHPEFVQSLEEIMDQIKDSQFATK